MSEQSGSEEGINQSWVRVPGRGSLPRTSVASLSVLRTCSEVKGGGSALGEPLTICRGALTKALSTGGVWGIHPLGE